MKLINASFITMIGLFLTGCDRSESSAYAKLKSKTGATDEQLEAGIEMYTDIYVLMRDKIEAGALNVEDIIETAKRTKEVMATVQREDEMAAVMTLSHLRTLESKGMEEAREAMAKQLTRFVEAEFPSTENAEKIRNEIQEYAKKSEAFRNRK